MALNQTQMNIVVPFVKHIVSCLRQMADLDARPGKPYKEDPDTFWLNDYAVCVPTTGVIDGMIVIHFYLETALTIGNRVHDKMVDKLNESLDVDGAIIQALEEYGNTVVGHATQDLANSDLAIIFEPPFFLADMTTIDDLLEGTSQILAVPLKLQDGSVFYFNYLIRKTMELS